MASGSKPLHSKQNAFTARRGEQLDDQEATKCPLNLSGVVANRPARFRTTFSSREQRYLILECKVRIFEDVVHEDNEFAHDGGERNFGGFSGGAQPLIKLFELPVGMGSH